MTLKLEIPDPLAAELHQFSEEEISKQFLEAWAAEAYRTGRFSTGRLARLLSIDRLAVTRMLGVAGVYPGPTGEETGQDADALSRILGSQQG
jgi:hypothetical protein